MQQLLYHLSVSRTAVLLLASPLVAALKNRRATQAAWFAALFVAPAFLSEDRVTQPAAGRLRRATRNHGRDVRRWKWIVSLTQ